MEEEVESYGYGFQAEEGTVSTRRERINQIGGGIRIQLSLDELIYCIICSIEINSESQPSPS
jgi:hypothetical protein